MPLFYERPDPREHFHNPDFWDCEGCGSWNLVGDRCICEDEHEDDESRGVSEEVA